MSLNAVHSQFIEHADFMSFLSYAAPVALKIEEAKKYQQLSTNIVKDVKGRTEMGIIN